MAPHFEVSSLVNPSLSVRILNHTQGKESEQNWSLREQDVIRIRGMVKGDAHIRYPDAFVQGLRSGILELSFKAVSFYFLRRLDPMLNTLSSFSACVPPYLFMPRHFTLNWPKRSALLSTPLLILSSHISFAWLASRKSWSPQIPKHPSLL